MGSLEEAQKAISLNNGKRLGDKMIFVKYANPKEQKPRENGGNRQGKRDFGGDFKNNDRQFKPRFGQGRDERPNSRDKEERGQRGDSRERSGFGKRQDNFDGGKKFADNSEHKGGFQKRGYESNGGFGKSEVTSKPVQQTNFDY